MVNTKNRSTPVVEKKKNSCECGCKDCTCGDKCKCGCEFRRTFLQCATILGSAVIIAGAIMLKPCFMGPKHNPAKAMHAAKMMKGHVNQEKAFGDFIMKNPKLLIDSVNAYYEKQRAEEEKAAPKGEPKPFNLADLELADAELVKQIIDDKTNYSLGNKKGKFVIIEFFDYQCGWCKRTNKGLEEAIASADGKNIRWIPIDTPIFGEASETIARYVLAAGEQGKYAEMHKAVGEAQGKLDEEALIKLAEGLKLNTTKLKAAANSEKIKGKLKANDEFRKKLNIGGVPMLIVDGHINPGALIEDRLEAVIKLSKEK